MLCRSVIASGNSVNQGVTLLSFSLQVWNALAPGLSGVDDWKSWLADPEIQTADISKIALLEVPIMLRRRFSDLGKCAAGSALPLLKDFGSMPGVFASRHGDTHLTLKLLQGIAESEPMSPSGFSLAVHNAVSGLISIARKDVSEITAISATEGLIPLALIEAATLLQDHERVFCVIYDVPLPRLYTPFVDQVPFPFAVALVLSRSGADTLTIQTSEYVSSPSDDLIGLMRVLCGVETQACFNVGSAVAWSLTRS